MLGKNEVAKPFYNTNGNLMVNEIFKTIQGEGPDSGLPAVFLRLMGCNLRCFWCDTEFETGRLWEIKELVDYLLSLFGPVVDRKCHLLVITGGEPLNQNILPLTAELNKLQIMVSIETAGTVWVPGLHYYFLPAQNTNKIVCSPKTPRLHSNIPPLVSAYKYIIRAGETSDVDGLPNQSTQELGKLQELFRPPSNSRTPIYVQPCDEGELEPDLNRRNHSEVARVAMKYGHRISLQCHKILGLR
jgi:7-carboxy-7-deazaguanine synthase